ncbi:hypothetical protein [Micromonospora sp. NPDC005205]|uniref:hypothetical protein n=1 Tax=Micromonospora sp. NPDC005205 TaxID=3156714 RepID=UPI0033AAE307
MGHEQLMYLAQRRRPPTLDAGAWHAFGAQIDRPAIINIAGGRRGRRDLLSYLVD